MALSQDLLTRIIDVHAPPSGGSVAVVGAMQNFNAPTHTYRNRMPTRLSEPNWQLTGTYVSSDLGLNTGFEMGMGCAVYANVAAASELQANPVFVMCGRWGLHRHPGVIRMSTDGVSWAPVFTGPGDGNVYAVCWDETERAFYAAYTDDEEFDDPPESGPTSYDVLLRSSSGSGWGEVSRTAITHLPETYVNPIVQHCGNKVIDANGNPVLNSLWGYREKTDTLIYPDPPLSHWHPPETFGTHLKIKRAGAVVTKSLPGFGIIWAVTYAGSIWHAGGETGPIGSPASSALVATSVDDGETWTTTFEGPPDSAAGSIASGGIEDFA